MRIAILTRLPSYYSEQRLSEEGKKRGHDVALIQYPKCYINLDSGEPEVRYEGRALNQIDAIIPRLTAGSVSYGAAIARQLEVMGVYTTASSIAISRAFDRLRSLQVLSRSGVEIPKTVFSRETEQWDDLLSHFKLPVVIRPATTTRGSGPVQAETAKAAIALMRVLSNNTAFMIQERVGEDSMDTVAMVVGKTVVASLQYDSIAKQPTSKTNTRRKQNCTPRCYGAWGKYLQRAIHPFCFRDICDWC